MSPSRRGRPSPSGVSSWSAVGGGRCGSTSSSRQAARRCRSRHICAATSCPSSRERGRDEVSVPVAAPRALAFEVLRETFEREGHTEIAFRAGAERLGLAGRDRAQAQRLTYGSVQRRGTSDAAIERLSGRAIRLLDPPVAAALRLGLYELLFADGTPDHAAVDQAVELVKIAKAGHAAGFVNAILRRAARERTELTA